MALFDLSTKITRPGMQYGTGDPYALIKAEYTGIIEKGIQEQSVLFPYLDFRTISGTNKLYSYAVGAVELQKLEPGVAPDPTKQKYSQQELKFDQPVISRQAVADIDTFIHQYDERRQAAEAQAKEFAEFNDKAMFIAARKIADMDHNLFDNEGNMGKGFYGASRVTISATDRADPLKLLKSIKDLMVQFQQKGIDPIKEGMTLFLGFNDFATLLDNELLINTDYITSVGSKVAGGWVLKPYGLKVVTTNHIPTENVSGHLLSSTLNSNWYDGDYTNTIGLLFNDKCMLCGQLYGIRTDMWFNKESKTWFVDSWECIGAGPNRCEYAGAILQSA